MEFKARRRLQLYCTRGLKQTDVKAPDETPPLPKYNLHEHGTPLPKYNLHEQTPICVYKYIRLWYITSWYQNFNYKYIRLW